MKAIVISFFITIFYILCSKYFVVAPKAAKKEIQKLIQRSKGSSQRSQDTDEAEVSGSIPVI